MTTLSPTSLRDVEEVMASKDEKLGRGVGLTLGEAAARLTPAERVAWVLAEVLYSVATDSHHRWSQTWASPESALPGPELVAVLADVAAQVDRLAEALLRFTAERAQALRAAGGNEPFLSVVSAAWRPALVKTAGLERALVERWPEGVDLLTLPRSATRRVTRPAASAGPRYPGAVLTVDPDAEAPAVGLVRRPDDVFDQLMLALVQAGAPLEAFDEVLDAWRGTPAERAAVVAQWVHLEGGADPLAQLVAVLTPRDPLAEYFGQPVTLPVLLRVPSRAALDGLVEGHAVDAPVGPGGTALSGVRAAARLDPELVFVRGADVTAADLEGLVAAAQVLLLAVWGDGPQVAALEAECGRAGVAVLRPPN